MPISLLFEAEQPGQTVTFDFESPVLHYICGIAHWSFTYGNTDHKVKTLALSLETNKPKEDQVDCKIIGTLSDDSRNTIKESDSTVTVCCIAVVQEENYNLTLASGNNIERGGESNAILLPGSTIALAQPFITGFELAYVNDDRDVWKAKTVVGYNGTGDTGQITATMHMFDKGSHDASASLDGGLVVANHTETGLLSANLNQQQTQDPVTLDFGVAISQAAVLVQEWRVSYPSNDRYVKTIGGGAPAWEIEDTKVILDEARAVLKDDSGHNQGDDQSWVSLAVLAVPAT